MKLEACRLCSASTSSLHDFGETALANEYLADETASLNQDRFPLHLVQCDNCGHVQLDYSVDPARMFRDDYAYRSSTTKTFTDHIKKLAHDLDKGWPGSSLIEIGSNDGTLIRLLDGPRKAIGVDPARVEGAINTIHEFWSPELAKRLRKTHGAFEIVLALNVYAHIADIHGFTNAVQDVLKHQGMFMFEVGYLRSMLEAGHYDVAYHEHLDYHHLKAISPFLKRHGLSVQHMRRIPTQGGSMRISARKGDAQFGGEHEPDLDVMSWAARIDAHGKALSKAVKELKPVGGFGAPAKTTTLLANAKLTRKHIPVVYDDNPLKAGKCVPGHGIPIRPTNEVPDGATLLLFSWNFADEIKKRFPRCKFLVPFPEPHVI